MPQMMFMLRKRPFTAAETNTIMTEWPGVQPLIVPDHIAVAPYEGLRYPLLKDETQPVRAKHALAGRRDVTAQLGELRRALDSLNENAEKITETPPVGHELFKLGVLTSKVPQFHLLAAGNPEPESVLISPLYQITIDPALRREAVAGD